MFRFCMLLLTCVATIGCIRPAYQRPQGFSASYKRHLDQRFPDPVVLAMPVDQTAAPDGAVVPDRGLHAPR